MSFAAVAALIAFYEALRPKLAQWHSHAGAVRRLGLYVVGIAFTTMVTTVATMPFTIYHVHRNGVKVTKSIAYLWGRIEKWAAGTTWGPSMQPMAAAGVIS